MPNRHKGPLEALVTLQRGFDITKNDQQPGPFAVISSSGPNSTHSAFMVKGPGVVVGRKGSLGTVFYSERDFWPHDTTLWVKDFHGNDPKFCYYFLRTMGLERFDCGASNPTLNRNHVHQIPVSFPCIEEQRRIASILSAYDDLIENNTRRIKILEEIAQSLYGEWFVHFRFPGHEKVPMADSALGPAPEGWVTQPLEAVCKRITDGSHWSPETVPGEQLMASSKDMHRWGLNRSTCRSIAKEDFASLVRNDCQPRAGDILITKDGANYLKYCFVVESDLDLVILSSIAVIRPNPLLGCSHFLALYLSDPDVKARLAANVSGAAIPRIVLKDFSRFTIMVPPIEIQRTFEGLVEPLASLCWRLVDKNVNLRATRDLLLPKLISGEILIEAADDQASKALEQVA